MPDESKKPPPIYIALLAHGGIAPETEESLEAFKQVRQRDFIITRPRGLEVGAQRDVIAADFLATDASTLMMIDHDIVFGPFDIEYVVAVAEMEKAVVAGLVSKRMEGRGWGTRLPPCEVTIGSDEVVPMPPHTYCGGAFMAVERSVFERIAEEFPKVIRHDGQGDPVTPFFMQQLIQHPSGVHEKLSEDWGFCRMARECGCKVLTAMRPTLEHIGSRRFSQVDGNPEGKQREIVRGGRCAEKLGVKEMLAELAEKVVPR